MSSVRRRLYDLDDAQIRLLGRCWPNKLIVSGRLGALDRIATLHDQPWRARKLQKAALDALVRPTPTVVVAVHSIRGKFVERSCTTTTSSCSMFAHSGDSTDIYDRGGRRGRAGRRRGPSGVLASSWKATTRFDQPVYVRKGDAVHRLRSRCRWLTGAEPRPGAARRDDGSLGRA